MKIIKVTPRVFASNSYILTGDGKSAVVIDPSEEAVAALKRHGLVCKAVLLTHGHFDHIGGCGILYDGGAKIYCGEYEKALIFSAENRNIFGGVYIPEFEIAGTFKNGETIELCGIKFSVIHTPGHTEGSVCYICENAIFTGDTLFCGGVGRTDLPTGSMGKLINSVKRIYALDGEFKLYCGHGEDSTLANERKYNPYVRG